MSDRPCRGVEAAIAGPPAFELVEVCKHFDGGLVKALDGLTLAVRQGESVAVTGPSGCGKSTMLHLLAALDRPTSGDILVGGRHLADLRDLPGYRRCQVGLVFQLHNLVPHLTALQNVELPMLGTGRSARDRRQRAMTLLADVDLEGMERRLPTRMSGGERQRVAIARALANEPALLLADEPTGSLDDASIGRILALLDRVRLARPSLTLVVVTHDADVAARADRIVRMRAGRLEGAGDQGPGDQGPGEQGAGEERGGPQGAARTVT